MPKYISCPYCEKDTNKTSYFIKESFYKKRYYYFCKFCNHKFLSNLNQNDVLFYYKNLKTEMTTRYFKGFRKRKSLIKKKLSKHIPNYPISICEIGPGSLGLFSLFNNQSEYIIVEPNQKNKEFLFNKNKKIIHYNTIDDVNETEIDFLISISCFEHFVNPKNEFNKILDNLKIGSTIVIGVPDSLIELPKFIILNEEDEQEDKEVFADKDHIHCFSQNSLKKMIGKNCQIIDTIPLYSKRYLEYIEDFSSNLQKIISKHQYLSAKSYLKLLNLIFRRILLKLYNFFSHNDYDFIIIAKKIK